MSVIVYSKPGCYQCTQTVKRFERHGVTPKVIDIMEDSDALGFVQSTGIKSMPVVVTPSSEPWGGFIPSNIDAACQ